MTSSIDPTFITSSPVSKTGMRTQLGYAKAEIEALQSSVTAAQSDATLGIANANAAQTTANAALPKAGGTMTGAVVLAANPAAPLQPATKQYVDGLVGQNRIINGACEIDQRNAGAAKTFTAAAALSYCIDRFYGYCTGANVTGQRVAGTAPNRFIYRFTGAASTTAIGFGQRIEAANIADLAGTTVSISVDLANSLLTSVSWALYYANTVDTFGTLASPTRTLISNGTFTGVSSTLTRFSAQAALPNNAANGVELVLSVGAQISGTWSIDNIALLPSANGTAFPVRLVQDELRLCYSYFYKLTTNLTLFGNTTAGGPLIFGSRYNYAVVMRTIPTVTLTTWVDLGNMPSANTTDSSSEGFTYYGYTSTAVTSSAQGYYPAGITASTEL